MKTGLVQPGRGGDGLTGRRSPILMAVDPLTDGRDTGRHKRLSPLVNAVNLFPQNGFWIQIAQEVWWSRGALVVERAQRRRHGGDGMALSVEIPTGDSGILMMILRIHRIGRRVRGRI